MLIVRTLASFEQLREYEAVTFNRPDVMKTIPCVHSRKWYVSFKSLRKDEVTSVLAQVENDAGSRISMKEFNCFQDDGS